MTYKPISKLTPEELEARRQVQRAKYAVAKASETAEHREARLKDARDRARVKKRAEIKARYDKETTS